MTSDVARLARRFGDPVVPDEETLRLEAALRPHTEVRSLQTPLLHHVNVGEIRDIVTSEAAWRMVEIMAWALRKLD